MKDRKNKGMLLPGNKRADAINKMSVKDKERGVKPVAKDTNKTRRNMPKPTNVKKPVPKLVKR